MMRYAIWNNKGGVGKTYFSFLLAAELALSDHQKSVIVADLCPQANLSEVLLGGNGRGSTRLSDLLKGKKRLTVGGYFDQRIESPHKVTKTEATYLLKVSDYCQGAPNNLYLLAGDPSLEIQSQVMSQICAQQLPQDSWKNVHCWLHDLLDGCENYLGKQTITLIDCNPSFSIYTEVALLAASRLLVPCTSDGSSARAIDNLAALVYGHGGPYEKIGFAEKCREFSMKPPLIQSVILNRTTQWQSSAARAFKAMFEEIKARVHSFWEVMPGAFVDRTISWVEIPDSHTATVVSSYLAKPLSQLNPGSYTIKGKKIMVNKVQIERYTNAMKPLVESLRV